MDTIREFMVSSSGLAPARRGMALGWVISVLSGVAILLGARGAAAEDCPDWYDCTWNEDCSLKDATKPIRCCDTDRELNTDTGQCETVWEDCFCTI